MYIFFIVLNIILFSFRVKECKHSLSDIQILFYLFSLIYFYMFILDEYYDQLQTLY